MLESIKSSIRRSKITYEIAEHLERTAEKDFSQTELCMLLQYDLLQENDREKAQQMLLASVEKMSTVW